MGCGGSKGPAASTVDQQMEPQTAKAGTGGGSGGQVPRSAAPPVAQNTQPHQSGPSAATRAQAPAVPAPAAEPAKASASVAPAVAAMHTSSSEVSRGSSRGGGATGRASPEPRSERLADRLVGVDRGNVLAMRAAFADIVDWDMAVGQCGGEVNFLVELFVDFYHEGMHNIYEYIIAANAYRAGRPNPVMKQVRNGPSTEREPFIKTLQVKSHTVKGTAANLGLKSLQEAARVIEMPLKTFMREVEEKAGVDDPLVVAQRKELLDKHFVTDRSETYTFVKEFRKWVDWVENYLVDCMDPSDPNRATIKLTRGFDDITVANFDKKIIEAALHQ